ncbi:MAG: lasso peptide biosynthesis B2 protein [Gammaproteobacteria bacterium]|nr:lasso peptide biosynthesis B2 protein [Gammaproteobacteria bacterium]
MHSAWVSGARDGKGCAQCPPSPDCICLHAARVFEALHPLVFASRNRCLFHSLALIEYLARHELYPRWVFGVQAVPFAAHCWVQQEGQVLNDTVEHVSRYTPILSI